MHTGCSHRACSDVGAPESQWVIYPSNMFSYDVKKGRVVDCLGIGCCVVLIDGVGIG